MELESIIPNSWHKFLQNIVVHDLESFIDRISPEKRVEIFSDSIKTEVNKTTNYTCCRPTIGNTYVGHEYRINYPNLVLIQIKSETKHGRIVWCDLFKEKIEGPSLYFLHPLVLKSNLANKLEDSGIDKIKIYDDYFIDMNECDIEKRVREQDERILQFRKELKNIKKISLAGRRTTYIEIIQNDVLLNYLMTDWDNLLIKHMPIVNLNYSRYIKPICKDI